MKTCVLAGLVIMLLVGGEALLSSWVTGARTVEAHCQVPCGIYDDSGRIARLNEDARTIAKAVQMIQQLGGAHDARAVNQVTRWITTKEEHASHIIAVVSEYFLTQKVKPVASGTDGYAAYLEKLADHHAVMVAAMKTKQNVSEDFAAALASAIHHLAHHYEEHGQ